MDEGVRRPGQKLFFSQSTESNEYNKNSTLSNSFSLMSKDYEYMPSLGTTTGTTGSSNNYGVADLNRIVFDLTSNGRNEWNKDHWFIKNIFT